MEDLVQISGKTSGKSRKGLYIKTFGCQMNEYDTDKLKKLLESDYASVPTPEEAELILVNTCSVRDKPEHKLYSLLGELHELKSINPRVMIGVGGCVAQQEGKNIISRSRDVDFVFGTHNLSLVPSLIELRKNGAAPQVAVDYRDEWEDLPAGFTETDRVSVFVSISRGCNKNCTYCIVPTTRGREVSRALSEIEREVRIAVHRGAKEIVLLGQTVNSWGLDFSPRSSFVELIRKISTIDGLERIRFTSPHPQEIRKDFIELVTENPKVCRHVHMPLQSGNDRVLKLMNRNYRRKRYLKIIEDIKARVPDMAVTTDIIVGFPGETREEFEDTMSVMEEVQYESSFSFIFSPRPGTKAAEMEDLVSYDEKLDRLQTLQKRQNEITAQKLASWVGKKGEILLDGPSQSDPEILQGRLSQNILVNLTAKNPALKPGMTIQGEITGASRYTLKAKVLEGSIQ